MVKGLLEIILCSKIFLILFIIMDDSACKIRLYLKTLKVNIEKYK